LLSLAVELVFDQASEDVAVEKSFIFRHLLAALAPSVALLGFIHGRAFVHRRRLRLHHSTGTSTRQIAVVFVLLLATPVLLIQQFMRGGGYPAAVVILGFWFLGMCIAGLVSAWRNAAPEFFKYGQTAQVISKNLLRATAPVCVTLAAARLAKSLRGVLVQGN
jgi:hypothetical protein